MQQNHFEVFTNAKLNLLFPPTCIGRYYPAKRAGLSISILIGSQVVRIPRYYPAKRADVSISILIGSQVVRIPRYWPSDGVQYQYNSDVKSYSILTVANLTVAALG